MSSDFSDRYRNKMILAPMVRIGTLPTRLLALDYGADLVYSDEIIDWRLLKCTRHENKILGTVDFIGNDHSIVFRTCNAEKDKVILQLGTCDPDRALKAAKFVESDVSGIDINMGCPKEFSLKGGMGAALLTQPDKIKAILTNLVQNLNMPVTCKIRVLPELEDTLKLVKMIESTGVAAIAVHGRTKPERPRHPCRNDAIKAVSEVLNIPVIANGGSKDIETHADIEKFRLATGASSVMVARAAEHNVSIFRRDGPLDVETVIRAYLKYAVHFDMHAINSKYCILSMLGPLQATANGSRCLAAQQMKELCDVYELSEFREQRLEEIERLTAKHRLDSEDEFNDESINQNRVKNKKMKLSAEDDLTMVQRSVKFIRSLFTMINIPKQLVITHMRKINPEENLFYRTTNIDRHFYSEVTIDGITYRNTYLEKNKKNAEQGAAIVAALALGLISEDKIKDCLVTDAVHERKLHIINK